MGILELNCLALLGLVLMTLTTFIVHRMGLKRHSCDITGYVLSASFTNIFASIFIMCALIISIILKLGENVVASVIALASSIWSLLSIVLSYTTEAYQGGFARWSRNYYKFSALTCLVLLFWLVYNLLA